MVPKILLIVFGIYCLSCNQTESDDQTQLSNDDLEQVEDTCSFLPYNATEIICPKGNHKDSIIPILYGFPSEEMFEQSDSGLILLGGCEVSDCDPNWWCNIHKIEL